jgi:thiamine-phosphate pyrophosphorylase
MRIPRLYAIADGAALARSRLGFREYAQELAAAGVTLVQYRDKDAEPQAVLRNAAVIADAFAGSGATLIMNDRADLAILAGWDGVHVGQGDLSPEDAKAVLAGARRPTHREEQGRDVWDAEFRDPTHAMGPHGLGTRNVGDVEGISGAIVGVSTHTVAELVTAEASVADYVAIGPVFATGTKLDASPVVGLEGVRRARALTTKPLVAIGGITRENARSVIDAGADAVAVISGLFVAGETVEKVARDFLQLLR